MGLFVCFDLLTDFVIGVGLYVFRFGCWDWFAFRVLWFDFCLTCFELVGLGGLEGATWVDLWVWVGFGCCFSLSVWIWWVVDMFCFLCYCWLWFVGVGFGFGVFKCFDLFWNGVYCLV